RDREHHADLGSGALDHRHHAGGRERDPPSRDGEPVAVLDDAERIAHRLEIVERLPHAHHHDLGDAALTFSRQTGTLGPRHAKKIAEPVARHHHLADDLFRREVANEALRAGVAERTVERAADLARYAQRAAVTFRDVDALDLVRPLASDLAG